MLAQVIFLIDMFVTLLLSPSLPSQWVRLDLGALPLVRLARCACAWAEACTPYVHMLGSIGFDF